MIINAILLVLQGVVNILLAPLTVLNIAVDFASSFSIVNNFIKVIIYLLPWSNLSPLFTFIFAMFVFRAVVALIKTIWDLLPLL